MSKKNREERRANRAQVKSDEAKVALADSSLKSADATRKAEKKRVKREGETPFVAEKQTPQPLPVKRINAVPDQVESLKETGVANYSLGEVLKNQKVEPQISGKEPVSEVISTVIDKAETPNEILGAKVAASSIKEVVDNVNNEQNLVDNQIKLAQVEFDEQKMESEGSVGETPTTESGYKPYAGDGSAIGSAAKSGSGQYDMTEEEFRKATEDFRQQNAAKTANMPGLALAELGIEHYFPPQQDYVTSNFTGRYIGSRQIVVSGGALFPASLADARRRAIQAKQEAKSKRDEEFWKFTDTAPQYDKMYKDYGMAMAEKFAIASGGDYEALARGDTPLSREWIKQRYSFESRGKMIIEADAHAEAVITDMNDEDKYVPQGVVKKAFEVRSAGHNFEPYMDGEGDMDMQKLTNSLRSWENYTPLADKAIEQYKALGPDELPLMAGADFSNPEFAANAEAAMASVANRDYTQYSRVVGKIYDLKKIREHAELIFKQNPGLYTGTSDKEYQEILDDATQYIATTLPIKIDIVDKFVSNKALGWETLYANERWRNKQSEWRKEDLENVWQGANRQLSSHEYQSGLTNAINAIPLRADGTRDEKLMSEAMSAFMVSQGLTPDMTGGYVSAKFPVLGDKVQSTNLSNSGVIGSDGKWKSFNAEINYLKTRIKNEKLEPGSKKYKEIQEDLRELRFMRNQGSNSVNMQVTGTSVTPAYHDEALGIIPIEKHKGEIDTKKFVNMAHISGYVGIPTGTPNDDGTTSMRPSKYVVQDAHNIGNKATTIFLVSQQGGVEDRLKAGYAIPNSSTVIGTSESSSGSGGLSDDTEP